MKNIKILIGIILIAVISELNAQNKSSVKMENTDETNTKYSESRSMIKLNPLLFFRGDIPIYYERSLNDKIAVEAGIGMTIIDYFNYNYVIGGFNYEENGGMGYSVRAGVRYYASDYSYMQEGFYFGINIRYQSYKSEFVSIEELPFEGNNDSENIDFRFHVGYLHMWEENFFIEPYVAFGLRNRTFQKISYNELLDMYSISKESKVNPIFSVGFKFGIAF